MEPTIQEHTPKQSRNPLQRPIGTYFSKPIVRWNTKCNFKRKELITQINERTIDNQLHCNYKDSSDDDSNEHKHSKKNSQFTVTSMGFEFNINKEIECDDEGIVHRNNMKCCVDDVPLFALVNTEDTPNKNESRNYSNTHANNNINISSTNSNMNNEMLFLSKNISSVGMSNTSQLQDYECSNGAKISMKDIVCETDYRCKRSSNNKHFYEKLKQFKKTNNNSITSSNKISNNNTITNTSTKHNSSLKTSQLYYNTNNVHHIKTKRCLRLSNKTTLTKRRHRVINSITSNHNNNSSVLSVSKRTKTIQSFFTSKIQKVIQHKLSHFILNQKDDGINASIMKIQLASLTKRTKPSKQQTHSIIKHNKHITNNNNNNNNITHRIIVSTNDKRENVVKTNENNRNKYTKMNHNFFYKHSTIYNTLLTK